MFLGTSFSNSQNSYDLWKKDKQRRDLGFTGDGKTGATFREASRQVQYTNPTFHSTSDKPGTSYKWEKNYFHDLPKSYGRSYDKKFDTVMNQLGVPQSERQGFRTYLDAQEKGKLQSTQIQGILDSATHNFPSLTASTPKKSDPYVANNRSMLNRVFSPFLIGNYASAGIADALVQKQGWKKAMQNAWEGVKASNPFGKGDTKGEFTYSKVLGDSGWHPTSWQGKLAKGTAGLALDIALDPTTYLTGGASAILKGTGRAGKVAELTMDSAKNIVDAHALQRTGQALSEAEKTKQAQNLVNEYNRLRGTNRTASGLSIGVSHLPGSKKVFGSFADKNVQLISGKALQKVGDTIGTARAYNKLRDTVYGSQIGKLFSTTSPLYKYAKTDPSKLYDVMKYSEHAQGVMKDKLQSEKAIRDYAKTLNFSPAETTDLLHVMQDHTLWTKVKRATNISNMQEAQLFKMHLQGKQSQAQNQLKSLQQQKTMLEQLKSGNAKDIADAPHVIKTLENEFHQNLQSLDVTHLNNQKDYNDAIKMIQGQSHALENAHIGASSPIKPTSEPFPVEPMKPVRPYFKKGDAPKEPTYQSMPDLPTYPVKPNPKSVEQTPIEHYTGQAENVVKNWGEFGAKKTHDARVKTVDELSQLIYGEPGKISPVTFNNHVEHLLNKVKEGYSPKQLQQEIAKNPHWFDGRSADIYPYLAQKYNYGKGTPANGDWNKFYTEPVQKMQEKINKGEALTPLEKTTFYNLEQVRLQRAHDIHTMRNMDSKQILSHQQKEMDKQLEKDFANISNSNNNAGSYDVVKDKETGMLRVVIRDKHARISADELAQARRDRFTSEDRTMNGADLNIDRAVKNKETGQYEIKHKQVEQKDLRTHEFKDTSFALSHDTYDEVLGKTQEMLHDPTKKPSPEDLVYAQAVVKEIPSILEHTFKRPWHDLNPREQDYAMLLAHKIVAKRGSEKSQYVISALSKRMKEVTKAKDTAIHIDAVQKTAKPGSPILFKSHDGQLWKGSIHSIHPSPDGSHSLYDVINHQGELVKDVKPTQITRVDQQKPQEIILQNMRQSEAERAFAEETAKYNAEVKRIDTEYARVAEQVKSANHEMHANYMNELADLEEKKKLAKESYDAQMKQYNDQMLSHLMEKVSTQVLNEATHAQWEKAIRQSSKVAEDYFAKSEELANQLKATKELLGHNDANLNTWIDTIEQDFTKAVNDVVDNVKHLEEHNANIQHTLDTLDQKTFAGKTVDEVQGEIDNIHDALASDQAFETYVEMNHADLLKQWDKKYQNSYNIGKYVLDTKSAYSDKLKSIAKELKGYFNDFGEKEIGIGKLTQEQFDANVLAYLPHIVTPDGARFFKKYKITYNSQGEMEIVRRKINEKNPSITQDLGYGLKWNPYGQSRTITKIKMPDGTWIENPTISQINKSLERFLKGKNAFSENIADIYITRALKHNELMYDNNYMHNMMETFGKDVPPDLNIEKGYKSVMNYGMFKSTMHEMAGLRTSLELSDAVGGFIRDYLATHPEMIRRSASEQHQIISREVEQWVKDNYPNHVMQGIYNGHYNDGLNILGMDKNTIAHLATPMLELNKKQINDVQQHYLSSVTAFEEMLNRQYQNLAKYPHGQDAIDRVMRNEEKLKKLTKLQIKQVNEVIVNKANQARKLQQAKDHNAFLRMYDKFTHFIKLNQTTIMPSFHARNFMSNKYLNWLAVGKDVADIELNKMVFATMKNEGDIEKLKHLDPVVVNGNTYHWNDLYELAKSHGAIDEGFFAKDIGAGSQTTGKLGVLSEVKVPHTQKKVNLDFTDTENFLGYKKGAEIGNRIENYDRFLQFVAHIKQGKTPEEATKLVHKYLFDYADLTAFEQNVMKRIFPYYTWLRKNGRLQATEWMDQPGKYRDVAKALNSVSGGVDQQDQINPAYLAPFAKDWKQTIFNAKTTDQYGKTTVKPVLWNPNLPFMDIGRLPDPANMVDSMQELFTQTNPIFKTPTELLTNKNFFFDSPIVSSKDDAKTKVLKRMNYMLSQNAGITASEQLVGKSGTDQALHALNTFTGNKFLAYNYDKAKQIAIMKALGKDKSEKVPVDKLIQKAHNVENALHGLPLQEQQHLAQLTDKFLNGDHISPKDAGIYQPFISVMKAVGVNESKARQWTKVTLDGTHLDKYLLGADFASGKVTSVMDGDTIKVDIGDKKDIKVRLNLVDTPETVDPRVSYPMPGGEEASHYTKQMLTGQDVRLVLSKNADKYGRHVAYVYHNNQDYQRELLRKGLARVRYVSLSDLPYNEKTYMQDQNKAFNQELGVWSVGDNYAGDPTKDQPYNKKVAMKLYLDSHKK